MNAKYFGKKVNRNEFGEVTSIDRPCVLVTMKSSERDKFERMMNTDALRLYCCDVFIDDDVVSAYVACSDKSDADDFMSAYKEAKREV